VLALPRRRNTKTPDASTAFLFAGKLIEMTEDIQRTLGRVQATLEALGDKIDEIADDRKEDVREARDSRHRVASALMATEGEIITLKLKVVGLESKVAPMAEEFNNAKQRGIGAVMLARLFWPISAGGFGGLVVVFKDFIFGKWWP
jgi:hypothetical protein